MYRNPIGQGVACKATFGEFDSRTVLQIFDNSMRRWRNWQTHRAESPKSANDVRVQASLGATMGVWWNLEDTLVLGTSASCMRVRSPPLPPFMPMWRNWKTRCTQDAVPFGECRFDPGHRHQVGDVGKWLTKHTANVPRPQGRPRSSRGISAMLESKPARRWTRLESGVCPSGMVFE